MDATRLAVGWFPFPGGRHVRTRAAVVPALLGALTVTALTARMFLGGWPAGAGGPEGPQGVAALIMNACHVPMSLRGPLVGVVAVSYALRRRKRATPEASA
ncbi:MULTISPECIES: hypothetical protein [unclassified Streptomyces]|uniref:hypothetical protein n=1 Tax=unclassified Streptomyces TaxID=2593676 RepID=UPI00366778F2